MFGLGIDVLAVDTVFAIDTVFVIHTVFAIIHLTSQNKLQIRNWQIVFMGSAQIPS